MHEIFVQMTEYFKSMGTTGLALNSFIESFFLVPPPDILLVVMDLANPAKALFYAFVCSIASALGGAIGYAIGYWGGRPAFNWFFRKGGKEKFEAVENLYNKYGTYAVFFSAFTPIPYKVFTIASGILNMNFWKFLIASFFGRGLRFFLVSIVLMLFGEAIKQYIEVVIIAATVLIIAFYVIIYKKRHSLIK
ncbi:MAG: YqaA family protein [Candidatus Avigastranaerophilus sp.]